MRRTAIRRTRTLAARLGAVALTGSAAALVCGVGLAAPAHATEVIAGSLIFGLEPANFYDPKNGFVPPGYGNESGPSITVPETFGFADPTATITAVFTSNTLTITELASGTSFLGGWVQTFDATGNLSDFFLGFKVVSDTFVGGLEVNSAPSDDTNNLTVSWAGDVKAAQQTVVISFSGGTSAAVVPEPSTWAMLLVGFAALGLAGLRAPRNCRPGAG